MRGYELLEIGYNTTQNIMRKLKQRYETFLATANTFRVTMYLE